MTIISYDGPPVGLMLAFAVGWIPLVVAGISALASIWSAKKQADAAKDAANIQVQGTKDAQGYIDRAYAEGKAALQPWLTTGGQATTTLGGLMGLGDGGGAASAPPTTVSTVGPNPILGTRGYAWKPRTPENETRFGQDTDMPGQGNWGAQRAAEIRSLRLGDVMTPAEAQTQSSYVTMRAPDGAVEAVPSQYVKHYTDLGATVVG